MLISSDAGPSSWQVLSEGDDGEVQAPVCQSCVGIYTEPPQLDGEVQTIT